MSIAVELTELELNEIKRATNQQDDVLAIQTAMAEFLRHQRRMRVKDLTGKVEMVDNWQELEATELSSSHGQAIGTR